MDEPAARAPLADPSGWATVGEVAEAARARLSREEWDFGAGGAGTETTLRRNSAAMDRIALRPRVLNDVSARDTATTVLGVPLSMPVMLAPIGSIDVFDPDGALASARGAELAGTAAVIGSLSSPSLDVVAAGTTAPLLLQIYPSRDRAWTRDVVQRAEGLGCRGIVLTVDAAVYGRRERDLANRFTPQSGARAAAAATTASATTGTGPDHRRDSATWADVVWLRSQVTGPLVIKGITHPRDAALAVEHGADAVYVSNHGGRQLDHMLATIDVLPDVVEAVAGRAEVLVDGGFTRGADVLKALALGAQAVLVGKLMAWGLGAAGAAGLARALELLRAEISAAMGTLGVSTPAQLGPQHVTTTFVPPPDSDPDGRRRGPGRSS